MPALEDLRDFAARLVERRNRAALLLHPRLPEQRAYAAQLAVWLQVPHLDVLDRFQSDEALSERVSYFTPDDLLALIGESAEPLLVVSGIEFLLGIWLCQGEASRVKADFCEKLELWERSPAFLLVTHEDPDFAAYRPGRHRGSRVVLPISETLALA